METATFSPVEVSREISEYGFMVVASSCFMVTSVTTLFLFIRWLMRIINDIIGTQQQSLKELLQSSKEQSERQKDQGKTLDEIRSVVVNGLLSVIASLTRNLTMIFRGLRVKPAMTVLKPAMTEVAPCTAYPAPCTFHLLPLTANFHLSIFN